MSSLQYFCYVSRNKVDQLYDQLDPEAQYELTETKKKETSVKAEGQIGWGVGHIISLFRVGGTYGRTGIIQREAKVKRSYMSKLELVLADLARQRPILPVADLRTDSSGWRHHQGAFRVEGGVKDFRADSVVRLITDLNDGYLALDCSLRNFSEGVLPDGSFSVNSANVAFFSGEIPLTMETVFLALGSDGAKTIGSPLFLKLLLRGNEESSSGIGPFL